MTTEPQPVPGDARAGRRPTVVAAGLLVVAAAMLWGSSRMTWVEAVSSDGLGVDRVLALVGGQWAAALTPLALALLAAVAAVFAVRGIALRVVAVAVAAVAVAAGIPAVQLLASGADPESVARIAELPDRAEVTAVDVSAAPALLALLGTLVALVAAVAVWRTPREKAGLSSRYDAPAARREAATRRDDSDEPVTERVLWDALDAGEDPTVDPHDPAENGDDEGEPGESGTRRRPS
ncbi:TIGR02234 family membrane protein [Rhodococcus sp. Z13]|uniref:TIGR02234 family membrane protein n=1 Tax=Rhodococcus sacchari TaxID=2962047 RepID=A0ACD4DBP4_9NOCA|nr:TIGR02234 family membrane protein [Rhodococcus sp. Z13]UYP17388.1 TIGR02234 family membrane protein [Rhodococcus sp. Z13]